MNELLGVLIFVLVLGLLLAGPILAIVAMVRTGKGGDIARAMRGLERRIRELEGRLAGRSGDEQPAARPAAAKRKLTEESAAPEVAVPQDVPAAPASQAPPSVEPELPERPEPLEEPEPSGLPEPLEELEPEPEPETEAPAWASPFAPTASELAAVVHVRKPSRDVVEKRTSASPKPGISWERWLGVRGFAAAGGVVLALAAILLFKHAIARGWISNEVRVAMGATAGVLCHIGARILRGKAVRFAPSALEGAGLVAFYATIWAASMRYEMLPQRYAFPLMGVVTAYACFLSMRRDDLLTAVIALVGGFATPLLLSTGQDRPITLFGYLLLLDLGLLYVGSRRRWPLIGMLAFLGTAAYESYWILERLDSERLFLGLGILLVFALLFAGSGELLPTRDRRRWLVSQATAVLFPFAFAVYFAARVDLGEHLWPSALLCAILLAAASWLERRRETGWLPIGAAVGSVSLVAMWLAQTDMGAPGRAWELSGVAVGLALVLQVFAEWERLRPASDEAGPLQGGALRASALMLTGLAGVLACSYFDAQALSLWPPLAGLLVVAALCLRQASIPRLGALALVGGAGLGLGLMIFQLEHLEGFEHGLRTHVLVLLAIGAAFLGCARILRESKLAAWCCYALGLALLPAFSSLFFYTFELQGAELGFGLSILGLTALLVTGAVSVRSPLYLALVGVAALIQCLVWRDQSSPRVLSAGHLRLATSIVLAVALLFPLAALLARRINADRPWLWRVAAFGSLALFFPLFAFYRIAFEGRHEGAPGLALGAGILALGCLLQKTGSGDFSARLVARTWFLGAAWALLAFALALEVETEYLALGLAFTGLALVVLGGRLDSVHPARLGALLGTASAAVLLVLDATPLHWVHGTWIWNEISYAHLVPAATLLLATRFLAARETELMPGEGRFLPAAALTGLATVFVVFLWINVTIIDYFTTGDHVAFEFERHQARDLTLSIGWAVYALILLVLGVAKVSKALRWTSLVLLLVTIAKVFLFDLGDLKGLYRVGSLTGLALSLLAVSVLYQRFVFRASADDEA